MSGEIVMFEHLKVWFGITIHGIGSIGVIRKKLKINNNTGNTGKKVEVK